MDTNKVSNVFRYLKNKYQEECVRLLRNLEFTIKKMADYRNHRRFTLICIKVSLTPVSCKLRNPLETNKSYNIIHKAEKQLLYERIRNINSILYMYEHNRCKQYSHLRNMINENEINSCSHLINRIKEHRHDKIKARQIDTFEHLYFKKHEYHLNFTRGSENSNNINTADITLSRHSHFPPSRSSTRSDASSNSSTPAAPTIPAPSATIPLTSLAPSVAPSHNSRRARHTCINFDDTKQKWVINLSNTPLTPVQESLLERGPNFAILPKYPPMRLSL